MDEQALRDFMEARDPEPVRFDSGPYDTLPCIGCAHSASGAPFPGRPSGERPCCSCVRNPEREEDARVRDADRPEGPTIVLATDGVARCFDPFAGTLYNGAPRVRFPSDNYVTLADHEQDAFLAEHPAYAKSIRMRNGVPEPVE